MPRLLIYLSTEDRRKLDAIREAYRQRGERFPVSRLTAQMIRAEWEGVNAGRPKGGAS